jgi:hypothetical protein
MPTHVLVPAARSVFSFIGVLDIGPYAPTLLFAYLAIPPQALQALALHLVCEGLRRPSFGARHLGFRSESKVVTGIRVTEGF